MKRCVIIGSGLGGLTCGVMLQRSGYDVTILEQGNQIGGCLQCFTRGGVKFETGMHFIGSALPGQILHKLMRFFSLDTIPLQQLDTSAYDIIALGDMKFRFANTRNGFINRLSEYFPSQRDNLTRYFDAVETVAAASSLNSLRQADTGFAIDTRYHSVSVNAVIDSMIDDPLLRKVLVGNLPLYAGEYDRTPFALHAFLTDFYNRSAFRVIGGSDRIAERLAETFQDSGGRILTDCKATKIICDNRCARAIEINGSETIDADIIIAAIHPARLIELVGDTQLLRPVFKQRLSAMRNTPGCFSLFLKFKPQRVPYMNSNFYSYPGGTPWGCENYNETDWPKSYLYMHQCHCPNPQFASAGVVLAYMNFEEVRKWDRTVMGRRGDGYRIFKQEKARRLLEALEKDFPGINDSISSFYTATPLTYADYTGTQHGSMYGVAKDITIGAAGRVPHKTRIPNLLLTGQNVNSHGILGVMVGTIVTCSELLSAEDIYRRIKESNSQ